MPELVGPVKVAGEAFITGLLPEVPLLIGEAALIANVDPLQPRIIGEALLLCIVDQTFATTVVRFQPVKGDLQWVDQP